MRVPNLPFPTGTNTQGIVSAYDVTPDWTPIYDKSSLDGYYLAIGTSGNQFKNAGVAGDLMATLIDMIENKKIDHDNEPFKYNLKNRTQMIPLIQRVSPDCAIQTTQVEVY